jgi:hypothetical protein
MTLYSCEHSTLVQVSITRTFFGCPSLPGLSSCGASGLVVQTGGGGVSVGVIVGVSVGVDVSVGVKVGVKVAVLVGVAVLVAVAVFVDVFVLVGV